MRLWLYNSFVYLCVLFLSSEGKMKILSEDLLLFGLCYRTVFWISKEMMYVILACITIMYSFWGQDGFNIIVETFVVYEEGWLQYNYPSWDWYTPGAGSLKFLESSKFDDSLKLQKKYSSS
jgi:hypothetical protein